VGSFVATSGQKPWPSAGSFVAAYGQFFMAADRGQLTDRSSRALTISADSAIHIHLPEDLKQSLTASAPGI